MAILLHRGISLNALVHKVWSGNIYASTRTGYFVHTFSLASRKSRFCLHHQDGCQNNACSTYSNSDSPDAHSDGSKNKGAKAETYSMTRRRLASQRSGNFRNSSEIAEDDPEENVAYFKTFAKQMSTTDLKLVEEIKDNLMDNNSSETIEKKESIYVLNSKPDGNQSLTNSKVTINQKKNYFKINEGLTIEQSENSIPKDSLQLYKAIKDHSIKPVLPKTSFNLAPYVNQSETLTNLVKLGVDLSRMEKDQAAANMVMKLDFEKDVKPYIFFLHQLGVPDDDIGAVFTKNPWIFKESLENLGVRINYLESKKFSSDGIVRVLTKAPLVLTMTTQKVDAQLGYLQRQFHLSGDDIRNAVVKLPKLITWPKTKIHLAHLTVEEFLGFKKNEIRHILLTAPKVYLSSPKSVEQRFVYLHNEMGLSHAAILSWPRVLLQRRHLIKSRHLFLKHLGRDQYDPTKPNFVSVMALSRLTDAVFCTEVAKATVQQFDDFMKTL